MMSVVLIVEQDSSYSQRIAEILKGEGLAAETCEDPDAARRIGAESTPRLLIASASLPDVRSLLDQFSRARGGPGAIVLVPTTLVGRVAASDYHADDLLAKPFTTQELKDVVGLFLPEIAPVPDLAWPPRMSSIEIFGDVLQEVEDEAKRRAVSGPFGAPPAAPSPAASPPPPPAAPPASPPPPAPAPTTLSPPSPAPAAAPPAAAPRHREPDSEDIHRKLEESLSGVIPLAVPEKDPEKTPARKTARSVDSSASEIDKLLNKTLSSLELPKPKKPRSTPPQEEKPAPPQEGLAAPDPAVCPSALATVSLPRMTLGPAPAAAEPVPPAAAVPVPPAAEPAPAVVEPPPAVAAEPPPAVAAEPPPAVAAEPPPAVAAEPPPAVVEAVELPPSPGPEPLATLDLPFDELPDLPDLELDAPELDAPELDAPDVPEPAEPAAPALEVVLETEEPIEFFPGSVSFEADPEPSFEAGPELSFEAGAEPSFETGADLSFEADPEPSFEADPEPSFEAGPEPSFEAGPEPLEPVDLGPPAEEPPAPAEVGAPDEGKVIEFFPGDTSFEEEDRPEPAGPVEDDEVIEFFPSSPAGFVDLPVTGPPAPEGEAFGDYTLLRKIAVGGMAEVWQARRRGVEGFQKTVAIKKILSHLTHSEDFVTMFVDEAKLAAQLNHNNIIQIYDLGKVGEDFFIAMEYVDGMDLRTILNKAHRVHRPLPMGLGLLITSCLARALDYAHRKRDFDNRALGLVHRDVSPQNVLISYEGEIKLCDFGIVKAVTKTSQTQMGALKGKLQYMSPEQAWGRNVDARSDIFSLGAVLFELLTDTRLFAGESELGVLDAVRECRTRAVREIVPEIPEEVDQIVRRALAETPEERYQTAGEMEEELKSVLFNLKPMPSQSELATYMSLLAAVPEEEVPPPSLAPTPVSVASGPTPAPVPPEPVLPDSLPLEPAPPEPVLSDSLPPDSLASDSLPPEPVLSDSLPPDYLASDSLPPDYLASDSLPPDSLASDSLPPDYLASDSLPPKAVPPEAGTPVPPFFGPREPVEETPTFFPESTAEIAQVAEAVAAPVAAKSGGGLGKKLLVAFFLLAVLAAVVYFARDFLRPALGALWPAGETPPAATGTPPPAPAPAPVAEEAAPAGGSDAVERIAGPGEGGGLAGEDVSPGEESPAPLDVQELIDKELEKRAEATRLEFEEKKRRLEAEIAAQKAAAGREAAGKPKDEKEGGGGGKR